MHETLNLQDIDQGARALVQRLLSELQYKQAQLDKLSYELALLKRMKFAAKSEALHAQQRSLLQEALEEDQQALAQEIEQLQPPEPQATATAPSPQRANAKRLPLPEHLPRQEFAHEPEHTRCCGQPMTRIGQDVVEKLDYTPGVFTVHRHVHGKWACACCHSLKQAPVDAHIIDKGIPSTGLLAQVLVAKYADHLPLYRQEVIYARAGVAIARSTLAQWVGSCGVQLRALVDALRQQVLGHAVLHADETPVKMLKPASQRDGKTHQAYPCAYSPGQHEPLKAVVYDFCESGAGKPCRGVPQRLERHAAGR